MSLSGDRQELYAYDADSKVTSVYQEYHDTHVTMHVRWHGKTIGKLTVDAADAGQLRDWLMPGGHCEHN